MPDPLPAWQLSQVRVVGRTMCLAWAPAMLGKEAPPGPAGRPAVPLWQDRQVPGPVAVWVGSATRWQLVHRGALAVGLVPEMAWQLEDRKSVV